jgi:hypothetical protein
MTTATTFTHRKGGHCGTSALRDLLEFHGLGYGPAPLSEGMVLGLGGGLAFAFADDVPIFGGDGARLPIYLNGRSDRFEADLCRNLGIGFDLRRTDDPAEGWRWLREELDEGRPTMVWANMRDLDYQRVKLDNTRHDIVVIDYDEDDGAAVVADYAFEEIQRCSLESLARARAASAFPGRTQHGTWVMEFPDALPDLRTAVASGIRGAVRTMRTEDEMAWQIRDGRGHSTTVPYRQGLRAIDALVESYASWPQRFGAGLRDALKLLFLLIELAGTGGSFYRAFQSEFLETAAELLDDAALAEVGAAYARTAAAWTHLARTVRTGLPLAAHRAGALALAEARERERESVALMERWVARA